MDPGLTGIEGRKSADALAAWTGETPAPLCKGEQQNRKVIFRLATPSRVGRGNVRRGRVYAPISVTVPDSARASPTKPERRTAALGRGRESRWRHCPAIESRTDCAGSGRRETA